MYAYLQGEFVPLEKAFLHVSDLSIQRGYGIFDFFKVENGHPFFLDDYLDRFYHSASTMRLEVPHQPEVLKSILYQLLEKNKLPHSGIKMILTGGYSADGYQPETPNLIITEQNLSMPDGDQIEKGIRIITHEYVRDIPEAKTINYSVGIWLIEKIKAHKAADVLYHQKGMVSEFPRCNFFIVTQDDTVITPASLVLRGITRKNILKLSAKDLKTTEGAISLADIDQAKEAFLTSTTKRIVPIVQIDDKVIGNGKPGPVTHSLLEQLIALESKDAQKGTGAQKFYRF